MIIEIKNFYPIERDADYVKGGLHISIQIADIELNVRGIFAESKKGRYFFRMPFRKGTCHKTGNPVSYPILLFSDPDRNRQLMNWLHEYGPPFIDEWLSENPVPEEAKNECKATEASSDQEKCSTESPMQKKAMP